VEDLGSTNGTYLNGRRLSAPSPMRKGDQLQVGSSVMEVI
jgi:pSer/pThr/pTyr-binding forkhead associated (FHA) protein